jgi:cell division protein FtsQ
MSKVVAYPGKTRRKREVSSKFWLLIFPFFFVLLAALYLNSSWALLADVRVEGNNHLTSTEIVAQSGLAAGDKYWRLNLRQGRDKLLENPWLASVSMERVFPNIMVVRVEERIPQVRVVSAQGELLVSRDGKVLGPNYANLSLPFLSGINRANLSSGADLSGNIAVAEAIAILYNFEEIVGNFSEINIDNRHMVLYTTDGYVLLVDYSTYMDKLLDLQDMLQYFRRQGRLMLLDLRTPGGRVIARPLR